MPRSSSSADASATKIKEFIPEGPNEHQGNLLTGTALVTLIVFSGTGQAQAQKTCSDYYQECVSHPKIKNAQSCVGAKARCMKTGRFIGPKTGRDYGTAEKR